MGKGSGNTRTSSSAKPSSTSLSGGGRVMVASLSEAQDSVSGFSIEDAVWDEKSVHKLSDQVTLRTNVIERRAASNEFTYKVEVNGKSIGQGSARFNDRELIRLESDVKIRVREILQKYKESINR